MSELQTGDPAPDFTLSSDSGEEFTLSGQRGRSVVLFFYPQDDTPGCTTEACGFSDLKPAFDKLDAVLAGISPDTVTSHEKFRAKYGLTTTLLADPDHVAIGAYGVWGPKQLAGRHYEGLIRTTFVIDPEGRIAEVFKVSRTKGHADQVLATLEQLTG